jgi:hypothetical protein
MLMKCQYCHSEINLFRIWEEVARCHDVYDDCPVCNTSYCLQPNNTFKY